MSDVFDEINEDLRRENMTNLWKKWGPWVIGICVIIIATVAGTTYYNNSIETGNKTASNAYEKYVTELATAEDLASVEMDALIKDHAGYHFLAKMALGDQYAAKGNAVEAVKAYDEVATNSAFQQYDQDVATLKSAFLLVDSLSFEEFEKRVQPLNNVDNIFRFQVRDLLGLSAYKAGDFAKANEIFSDLEANAQTPETLRSRAAQMLSLLKSKI